MTSIKPSTNHAETIYDEISKTYEEKYVAGGFQNSYMVDEFHAKTWWLWSRLKGRIVSLGVGSGQDIEILGHPDPADFTGYDISEGMLANARQKFPAYADRLIHHDCEMRLPRGTQADVLVSMFGAPNYLGAERLLRHYDDLDCKGAFFVFYNEFYDDGLDIGTIYYSKQDLFEIFTPFFPTLNIIDLFPGSNYYVVMWNETQDL